MAWTGETTLPENIVNGPGGYALQPGGGAPAPLPPTPAVPVAPTTPPATTTPPKTPAPAGGTASVPTPPQNGSNVDPFTFGQVVQSMTDRMKQNDKLFKNRNVLIQHMYSSTGVPPADIAGLDPKVQELIKSGSRPEQEMYLRMVNDQISGHNQTLDTSIKFLADEYNTSLDRIDQQKKDAIDAVTKIASSSPGGIAALKAMYPQYADLFDSIGASGEGVDVNSPGSGAQNVISALGISDPSMTLSDVVSQYGTDPIVDAIIKNEGASLAGVQNNPGNIKFNNLPGQVDSGIKASDGGTFASYATPEDGRKGIADIINKAASGSTSSYGQNPTITNFMNTYTNTYGQAPMAKTGGEEGSILSAAGLSLPVFNYLTQGTASMSRLPAAQRNKIVNEATAWLNKEGIDISTFQSQYKAYNETLNKNIQRFNNVNIAEGELLGTIDNLSAAADEKDFKKLKVANVAKLFAGEQVNDPTTIRYATHLNQIKSELAYYNAATQGKTSTDIRDFEEAERVIKQGISAGGLTGFKDAIEASTTKMGSVLQSSVDRSRKQVWDLFGVGDKFNAQKKNVTPEGYSAEKAGIQVTKPQYDKLIASVPAGEVLVYDKATKQFGHISPNDPDKWKYIKVPKI